MKATASGWLLGTAAGALLLSGCNQILGTAAPRHRSNGSVDGGAAESPCDQGLRCGESCVDPRSTDAHCGACNHSCGGDGCELGICRPRVIADHFFLGRDLAVRDGTVYWTLRGVGSSLDDHLLGRFDGSVDCTGDPTDACYRPITSPRGTGRSEAGPLAQMNTLFTVGDGLYAVSLTAGLHRLDWQAGYGLPIPLAGMASGGSPGRDAIYWWSLDGGALQRQGPYGGDVETVVGGSDEVTLYAAVYPVNAGLLVVTEGKEIRLCPKATPPPLFATCRVVGFEPGTFALAATADESSLVVVLRDGRVQIVAVGDEACLFEPRCWRTLARLPVPRDTRAAVTLNGDVFVGLANDAIYRVPRESPCNDRCPRLFEFDEQYAYRLAADAHHVYALVHPLPRGSESVEGVLVRVAW